MAIRHPLQNTLAPLLYPLSLMYGGAALARRRLTERGALSAWLPPQPCVSVGNISWGGTGKTPVTDWLLDWAITRGLRPAVLTRGYGATPPFRPFPVTPDARPSHSGDEPLMLARRHPHALILADPDRNRAARAALADSRPPDLFVLDDGFQHLTTGRHLDLVLLDADDLIHGPASNWNRVLPAGTWREPAAALHAAGAFLVKLDPATWPDLLPVLRRRLAPFPRPVFAFRLRPQGLRPCGRPDAGLLPASALPHPYVLVSGVGKPRQVRSSVEEFLGRPPEHHLIFPDHHDYARHPDDVQRMATSGLAMVCTAKDAVKLEAWNLPELYALEVEADFYAAMYPDGTENPDFVAWWETWWKGALSTLASRA